MTDELGRVITAQVTDENQEFFFAQVDGITYQIDKTELNTPLKIGGMVRGFAYENDHHQRQITKNTPKVQKDHYAFGEVVATRHDLGVFVNIGLANKDVVVSLDELPTLNNLWPKKGDRLLLDLIEDKKERLWGHLADQEIFDAITVRKKVNKNDQITGTAFRLKLVGTYLITDDYQVAFVHNSERDVEPRLGQSVTGRVIGQREDGVINLSLKPLAYEMIDEDAAFLLGQLQRQSSHSLPFNDKSEPAAIKAQFGFSKSQFKRAIGHLLKAKHIAQDEQGIHLIDD